jgi:acetamidase/formamidase
VGPGVDVVASTGSQKPVQAKALSLASIGVDFVISEVVGTQVVSGKIPKSLFVKVRNPRLH